MDRQIDRVLQNLVARENADDTDEGYPVILTCNGLVIAGRIVSGLKYATAVGGVDPFLNSLPEAYSELVGGDLTEEIVDGVLFIHLKDVTVYQGGAERTKLNYWRGQLARVDGWSQGSLTTASRSSQ